MSDLTGEMVSEELVNFALSQLQKEGLLENEFEGDSKTDGGSRRELIKKIGLSSAIALPLIGSIVAPAASQAQSGCLAPNVNIVTSSAMTAAEFEISCLPLMGQCCSNVSFVSTCIPFINSVICDCTCM